MKTLLASRNLPLSITTRFPLKDKTPSFHHQKYWKIHSSPKGFSNESQTSIKKEKIIQTDEFPINRSANSKNEDGDDKIPDAVFERMIARILLYTGLPMGIGLVFLQLFSILKENNLLNVPTWLPFLTTFFTFGSSALGIAYGALSTSLEPEEKGSVLGFNEAKRNWVEMWKDDN